VLTSGRGGSSSQSAPYHRFPTTAPHDPHSYDGSSQPGVLTSGRSAAPCDAHSYGGSQAPYSSTTNPNPNPNPNPITLTLTLNLNLYLYP
jgi:hypothetical protein